MSFLGPIPPYEPGSPEDPYKPPIPGNGKIPPPPGDGSLGFTNNNWTGFVTKKDFDRNGNFVTFSPAPPGIPSAVQTLLLLLLAKKLMETEKGQSLLVGLIEKYLDTTGDVLDSLYQSSAAHPLTAIINARIAVNVYERMGMIAPNKALQERAWIDHVLGEFLLSARLEMTGTVMQGIQSLVHGTRPKSTRRK